MLKIIKNSKKFEEAADFLKEAVNASIRRYLDKSENSDLNRMPEINVDDELYLAINSLLSKNNETNGFGKIELNKEEYLILLITVMPNILPNFFESVIFDHFPNGGEFPEFGGVKGTNHRGMLPTGETVQFILASGDIEQRLRIQQYFNEDHLFYSHGILSLEPVREGEPQMSGRLIVAQEFLDKILFGKETAPKFSFDFPAKRITTNMDWDDLVLHPQTLDQINDINIWLRFNEHLKLDENLGRKIKPGYRVLFYGPAGTGKTLTATLFGKEFKKDVYRIDLSQVISKYIGETEKNLQKVFDRAEHKDWILFFDEADALFSKRTNISSSHDKYANQEVSFLLQRVEEFSGLLILASNLKSNLDDAFIRRFHSVVHFPVPNQHERLLLWQKAMPSSLKLNDEINLVDLSKKYELTGANIINIVQYAFLRSLSNNDVYLRIEDIVSGIKKEFVKEEKSI